MARASEDRLGSRKERGAFFTPPAIAQFLVDWAVREPTARVMDPTCGEAVFLLAAARKLKTAGACPSAISDQVTGIDVHEPSLRESERLLAAEGFRANLVRADLFDLPTPAQIGDGIGWQDAVVGNPPFVRFQRFGGDARVKAAAAALAQGVRLSGLASSWAPTLVHAAAFLKPDGRLAMVCPAELLTVHYAEPVRRWLRERFASVKLVMFDELQFRDAEEQVVLLVAEGRGPCDGIMVHHVRDAAALSRSHVLDGVAVNPAARGKWSDLVLPMEDRQLIRRTLSEMGRLADYGVIELGTVTGANDYFALTEVTRREYGLEPRHLKRISPPGTRHLTGLGFSSEDWERLRDAGERVWLFCPGHRATAGGVRRYIQAGEQGGVHDAYKCRVRRPWWRPPVVEVPDLFFTYMSHRYPRLIRNTSGATILNSMHGVRLSLRFRDMGKSLALLAMNSATMVGAELLGRSYGGGVLKLEPREAADLPVPRPEALHAAWTALEGRYEDFDERLRRGEWWTVIAEVDRVLLKEVMGLRADEVSQLRDAATLMRSRRTRKTDTHAR